MVDDTKPIEEDLRYDDAEFNPKLEPKSSKAWINLLKESEEAFENWNTHCDRIDKNYANTERLAEMGRERAFSMFWANAEVIKPAIYAKSPVPVVVPKFKDRRPVYQTAAEIMERCCTVAFDLAGIDELMKLLRDDLALIDRGVAWCRYESGSGYRNGEPGYYAGERVCIDFKSRRDFLHSISRNWREVTWVAAASYLTRSQARDRFYEYSGDAYQDAEYRVDKDSVEVGGADYRERAKFWEVWDKGSRRVVWVAEGCDEILDEDDPHLDLREFFPCPKPAYGTVQRGSLVPVPDVLQYRDQLDEINLLTSRIHALSDAVTAKGFYPAGGNEAAEAIEAAIKINTPGSVLVPISNWAAFGQTKEIIVWMPIDMIVQTITGLVALRKQIIDDVYQLTGLSDIMRGATDPQETLGAQQLKTQFGSVRIRDKQQELVRIARDLVEITSEIITEKFDETTIIEMSQTLVPTQAMLRQQIEQAQRQLFVQNPDPQAAQQASMQLQSMMQQPTLEQVMHLFRDCRAKSFILDIETDSTIMADEGAEKQARTEFVGGLSQLLPQLAQMIQADPHTAEFCGELLKFATAPFRAGRSMDGAIDNLVELMKQKANQPQQPDPETMKQQTQLQIEQMKLGYAKTKDDADRQVKMMDIQTKAQQAAASAQYDNATKQMEVQGRAQEHAASLQQTAMQMRLDQQHHAAEMQQAMIKAQAEQAKMAGQMQLANQKAVHADQAAADRRQQAQFRMMQPRPGNGSVV